MQPDGAACTNYLVQYALVLVSLKLVTKDTLTLKR
jgi:hypothetical protein